MLNKNRIPDKLIIKGEYFDERLLILFLFLSIGLFYGLFKIIGSWSVLISLGFIFSVLYLKGSKKLIKFDTNGVLIYDKKQFIEYSKISSIQIEIYSGLQRIGNDTKEYLRINSIDNNLEYQLDNLKSYSRTIKIFLNDSKLEFQVIDRFKNEISLLMSDTKDIDVVMLDFAGYRKIYLIMMSILVFGTIPISIIIQILTKFHYCVAFGFLLTGLFSLLQVPIENRFRKKNSISNLSVDEFNNIASRYLFNYSSGKSNKKIRYGLFFILAIGIFMITYILTK